MISLIGFLANIISINYFIKCEKSGLANKLMICLNFTDLLTSFTFIVFYSYWLVFYIHQLEAGNRDFLPLWNVRKAAIVTFTSTCIISGCLTFVLTLLRTIVIYNPFYRIKQKLFVSFLVFIVVVLVALMQILAFWTTLLPSNFRLFPIYALMTVVLSCCIIVMSAVTIIVLKKTCGDGQQQRNHAAVTMVIISVIYFTTSFPGLVMFLIPGHDGYKAHTYVLTFSLSSLLNPMVYIFRKRQMHRYIKEQLRKLIFCR